MAADKNNRNTGEEGGPVENAETNKQAVPDEEVREESSKAANAAMNAQKKAKELKLAAAGAGDPDERQKLMEQAINAQIEAESFGKTAKYLRSGTFQGAAIGTGIGVAPGASLGALTGTLVGGVTSTITGGLGLGIGAGVGSLNGPFWNLGELAGKGVRKFTGDLPGWVASDEQKQALEKMMGQIQEEDMPNEKELKRLHEEGGSAVPDEGWMSGAKKMVSSMGGASKSSGRDGPKGNGTKPSKSSEVQKDKASSKGDQDQNQDTASRKRPRKLETKSDSASGKPEASASVRKAPRKLETKSKDDDQKQDSDLEAKWKQSEEEKAQYKKKVEDLEAEVKALKGEKKEKGYEKAQPRKLQTRS
ncbi:hypothetical protein EK21DRAFT_79461 [Setomelanomma holmii]|uniref:Uncharacterized protein n=1 Tax=Setomelanomma holmii TaxID=210430 RepID=A0A9P4LH07_9PLEO|nr:hypothetical protein EK21DRAFT_79461 [Setomelanomma holmii]